MMRLGLQTALHGLRQPRLLTIGTGNGTTTSFTQPPQVTPGTAIYVNDWQGNQLQYSTPRTNGSTYSEDFTNSNWGKYHVSVTSGATTAPDGTVTAQKFIPDTTTPYHQINQVGFTTNLGAVYTFSVYLKAAELTTCSIQLSNTNQSSSLTGEIDLTAGTIVLDPNSFGSASASIELVANGFYRVSVTGSNPSPLTGVNGFVSDTSATAFNGTDGFYLWGAQLEQASSATSYIPTTTSAVTQTDYSLSGGNVVFAVAPPSSAAITATV